jgi:hypothetical protein
MGINMNIGTLECFVATCDEHRLEDVRVSRVHRYSLWGSTTLEIARRESKYILAMLHKWGDGPSTLSRVR